MEVTSNSNLLQPGTASVASIGFGTNWWKLPLDVLDEKEEISIDVQSALHTSRECHCDWWKIPLGALIDEDVEQILPELLQRAGEDKSHEDDVSMMQVGRSKSEASTDDARHTTSTQKSCQPLADLREVVAQASKAMENATWSEDLQRRLQAVHAVIGPNIDDGSISSTSGLVNAEQCELEKDRSKELPTDMLERIVDMMTPPIIDGITASPKGLDACARISREWASLVKIKWRKFCVQDWGIKRGTRKSYREWVKRWKNLQDVAGVRQQNASHHAFIFVNTCPGTVARKRLYAALETLVELGAACNTARFPILAGELLEGMGITHALLLLLEDETRYLRLLAVRCLADAAARDCLRLTIRESIVTRGPLMRNLLEIDDDDMAEATSRLMINCHSNTPGAPLSTRCRGPAGFTSSCVGTPKSTRSPKALKANVSEAIDLPSADASTWSGVWSGEMRYARGGERHAVLRLVLGSRDDPLVTKAVAEIRRKNKPLEKSHVSASDIMHAEGNAEFWRGFGFLAASDFESRTETLSYMDEQLQLRRQAAHLKMLHADGQCPDLIGEGWDEQNGHFTIHAELPQTWNPPTALSSRLRSPVLSGAMPLRMTFKFEKCSGHYELVGFLAEASLDTVAIEANAKLEKVDCPCALYGVWATPPALHKHLFLLQKIATLSGSENATS